METLSKGFTLEIYDGCFPLSTDSMVLADFVRLPKNARVLDLGAGCGTLGHLLCARRADCHVTGLELQQQAHEGALKNIARNALEERMQSIHGDLRQCRALVDAGAFHVCLSNPPYFSGGPAAKLTAARRTDCCTMDELFEAAAWALKFGGDFFLVHRPESLAQLFGCACAAGLEPKRLALVRHRPADPPALVLVQCRKGAKPGLKWEEWSLFDQNGEPTALYQRIYR